MVRESEMMKVAGCIGNNWRQVGIMALDMNTTTLEQIEEDNKLHKERVFAMLRRWSMREREKATPARLYFLLTQEEENGINSENLNFLMENNWGLALCSTLKNKPLEGDITASQWCFVSQLLAWNDWETSKRTKLLCGYLTFFLKSEPVVCR